MNSQEYHFVPALGMRFLTPLYDTVVRWTTRERRFKTALIAQCGIQAGHRVLDLACGTGTLAIWAKQAHPNAEITGIDGDPAILEMARRKARSSGVAVGFHHGLSHSLPCSDASFDRVLSSLFFHHLSWQDKERTAPELLRVLEPGGELHVADWGAPSRALMRALHLPVQCLDGFSNTNDNVQGKLVPLFEASGFIDVRERNCFDTPLGTLRLFRASKPP